MTHAPPAAAGPDNFAHACCGRWAADRARFALYCADAGGAESAWTFWDIEREAGRFCNVLAALGVMRGERVLLLLPQCAETAALHVACYQMGAVAVPLPPDLGGEALEHALAASGCRVAVIAATGAAMLGALPAARRPRAIGIGGATAEWLRDWGALRLLASPRYTPLDGLGDAPALLLGAAGAAPREFTHTALALEAERFADLHPGYPQPGDLFWSPADWATPAGLLEGLLPAWRRGQPLVAYDGGFEAAAAVALIARYEVRNALLTPQQLEAMKQSVPQPNQRHDCRLRTLSTGAPLDAPLAAWVRSELGVAAATPG